MPTYRGGQFVARAIDSVLVQTFRDFELIIVDDNSPDDTASIVARYDDPRIRFVRNPRNLGPEGNWNRCLDEATGRYFKLLHQDDVLAPECLASQVSILEADLAQEIALTFCARNIIDADDRVIMVRRYPCGRAGRISGTGLIRRCMRWGTNLVGEPAGVLFRLALARKVGKFNAEVPYVTDLDYWVRLLLQGDAHYEPASFVSYRVSAGSWSVAIGKRQTADFNRFMAKVSRRPELQARRADLLTGRFMARLNTFLRMMVYRRVIRRERRA